MTARSIHGSHRRERGIAAVEFALFLPILSMLCLLAVEASRYLLLNMKLSHAANSIADLATRERELSVRTLDDLFLSTQHIIAPFSFSLEGVVIVSGVSQASGLAPRVSWQRRGAGPLTVASDIGAVAEDADLPEEFSVGNNQTIVAAEVFYQYQPWLMGAIPGQLLYHASFYRPRMGMLTELAN